MKLPKSFDELTVSQYQEIDLIIKENDDLLERHIKILSCLSGLTIDQVESNTPSQIKEHVKSIEFIYSPETLNTKIVKRAFVDGAVIAPILEAQRLSAGQLLTLKHLEEQNKPVELLHQMLACLYVECDKLGFQKEYQASNHSKMAETIKKAKMGEVYGTLFFYSNVFERSNQIIQIYSSNALKTIEETIPEVMDWAKKNPQILKQAGLKLSSVDGVGFT